MAAIQGVLSVDWFEVAGCTEWGQQANQLFDTLKESQQEAQVACKPIVCPLGDGQIFMHERGMGSKRGSRLEYRLEWCGSTIGISQRERATRQLSNFYLKVPGEACLCYGFDTVHEKVHEWLSEWGGDVTDEWFRRLDLCFDTVDVNLQQNIFPAFVNNQFVATAEGSKVFRQGSAVTGVTIGSERGASVTIYDKLAEVKQKQNAVYQRAMTERWGGTLPATAARIEYRLHREFLQQFEGLKTVANVIARLGEVVERLVQTDKRPFFKMTDQVPDRKGRNQDKVGTLPEWASIVEAIKARVAVPLVKLNRMDRGLIDCRRAISNAVGYLTSAAAQRGVFIGGREDLIEFFGELLDENNVSSHSIKLKWEDKTRRCGTYNKDAERDCRIQRQAAAW